MAHCSPYLVPLALFCLGAVAIMLLTIRTEDTSGVPDFSYGIVVDAGSSHTAMYIYKWPADKQNGTGVVTQHRECLVKGGGISSYAGQSGGAGRSLEACLDDAVTYIPKARHPKTPIYLGATAGMRLLHVAQPDAASQILQEVGQKIKSYPFQYHGAAILRGSEEGAYGWVTVNYLLENLIKYGFVGRWLSPDRPTVGALDLGGASTQITFVTEEQLEAEEENAMHLRLYGRNYTLYTHSYLCYGRDQALMQLLSHLIMSQSHGPSGVVSHPCYPVGYEQIVETNMLLASPCVPDSLVLPPGGTLRVSGTGQYDQCLANVSLIFDFQHCTYSRCSFNNVFQPGIAGNFMAFSAFYFTHSFLEKVAGIHISTPAELEEAAKIVCRKTFEELKTLALDQESRLQSYCATAVFVKVLLLRGYGFDRSTFPHISFQRKAGDTSVGWALGYMLSLSSFLPAEGAPVLKSLTQGAWAGLLTLFIILLILTLVFSLIKVKTLMGKRKHGGETNI